MARKRLVEARSPEYAQLGQKLAQARESMNLSQAEAAKLIGISQGTYSGYETGTRRIKLPMLKKIADAYGVKVDWLIGTGVVDDYVEDENLRALIDVYNDLGPDKAQALLSYANFLKDSNKGG